MRFIDSHEVSQLNELKIDTGALVTIAGHIELGDTLMIEQMPIVGGYVGSVPQTIVSNTATHLGSFALLWGDWHLDGPVHVRWGTTTAREALQVAGHTSVAMNKYTETLLGNQYYTLAGPCTELCFLETATQAITDTVSGREVVSGVASAKGVALDMTTGMEARMMGEACRAANKLTVKQGNELINTVLEEYDRVDIYKKVENEQPGKRFQECYDAASVKPTEEHLKVYGKAYEKLKGMGLPL